MQHMATIEISAAYQFSIPKEGLQNVVSVRSRPSITRHCIPRLRLRRFLIYCLFLLFTVTRATSYLHSSSQVSATKCNDAFYGHSRSHDDRSKLILLAQDVVNVQISADDAPPSSLMMQDDFSATKTSRTEEIVYRRKRQKRIHPISSVFEPTSKFAVLPSKNVSSVDVANDDYQRRKQEWAARYATLNGLRDTFGSNQNKLWGDLDPTTTRKLYKSLLPTALCELVLDLGVNPEELAQLAYEARKAAKLYARERCQVPARVASFLYDGFRQLKRYGRFQPNGMSYDQVWDKYRSLTYMEKKRQSWGTKSEDHKGWTEEEIVARTCMKILESSCRTNPRIDRMTLEKRGTGGKNVIPDRDDLLKIAQTLEEDVRRLLDPYSRPRSSSEHRENTY
jgi:hypothetical protein